MRKCRRGRVQRGLHSDGLRRAVAGRAASQPPCRREDRSEPAPNQDTQDKAHGRWPKLTSGLSLKRCTAMMSRMSTTTRFSSYEEARESHRWEVPERYNIALDVCDRHPREKLAMIHEDFRGRTREVSWGELQDDSNRLANVLRAHGIERGDRVAMLLPATPETAAAFFGVWKAGAILLSMSVLYGDEGIRHRVSDSRPKVLLTNAQNAGRIERDLVEHLLILDDQLLERGSTAFEPVDTAAGDPAQLYYSSG